MSLQSMLINYLKFVTKLRLSDLYNWAEVACSNKYHHRHKLLHPLPDRVFSPVAMSNPKECIFSHCGSGPSLDWTCPGTFILAAGLSANVDTQRATVI